jgi:hypothetical protein
MIRDWGLNMREWGAGCEKMRVFSLSPSFNSLQHRKHVRLAIIVAHLKYTVDDPRRDPETHQGSHRMRHLQKTQDQV